MKLSKSGSELFPHGGKGFLERLGKVRVPLRLPVGPAEPGAPQTADMRAFGAERLEFVFDFGQMCGACHDGKTPSAEGKFVKDARDYAVMRGKSPTASDFFAKNRVLLSSGKVFSVRMRLRFDRRARKAAAPSAFYSQKKQKSRNFARSGRRAFSALCSALRPSKEERRAD